MYKSLTIEQQDRTATITSRIEPLSMLLLDAPVEASIGLK
jgi:hypothetical protein